MLTDADKRWVQSVHTSHYESSKLESRTI